nr:hypothetical protein [Tanacetum cinerariifolium]
MSGSDPGEMAPESSKAVVFPKSDMHIFTFELTSSELGKAVEEYSIPLDLHLRLPPLGMTMNKLSSRYIGLYIEQLEQGAGADGVKRVILFEIRNVSLNINPTLVSFENKTGGRATKCFKDVTSSLKGWNFFFLLDCRAFPDAVPWRHDDTDLDDDFSANYNENDVARLSEFLVPLRPHLRYLLYMCGLTMACRHPELHYNIKDQVQNVIDMDTFMKLPTWTETIVSRGDPIPEDQRPKPRVTLFGEAERAGARGAEGPKKKRKREVVDLSGNTRVPTLSAAANQPSPHIKHYDTHENKAFDAHSSQSSHQGNEDEPVDHQYVRNWGLCDDVRNRNDAYSVELEHLRSSLRRENQDKDGLTKKLTLLESAHSECSYRKNELLDRVKDLERDEWRATALDEIKVLERDKLALSAEVAQAEADLKNLVREFIHVVVKRLHTSVEYIKSLAFPVSLCFTTVWLGGLSLGKTEDQIAQFLSEYRDLDIEGSKLWVAKHRELFTIPYPCIQKFAKSYDLSMSELLEVSPDVHPLSKDGEASSDAAARGSLSTQPTLSLPSLALSMCIRDLLALFHQAIGLWVCYSCVHLLDLLFLTPTFKRIIQQLRLVVCYNHPREIEPAYNILPYDVLYILTCGFSQGLCFYPLSEIIDCHNDELEFAGSLWERSQNVEAPPIKRPWRHDGCESCLWQLGTRT